jgi:hypothetical protein
MMLNYKILLLLLLNINEKNKIIRHIATEVAKVL